MPMNERYPDVDPIVQWDAWPLDQFEQSPTDDRVIATAAHGNDSALLGKLEIAPKEGRCSLVAWVFQWGLVLEEIAPVTDLEHRVEISRLDQDWRALCEQSFDVLVTFDPKISDPDDQIRWFHALSANSQALANSTFYGDSGFVAEDPDLFVFGEERSPVLCNVLTFGVSGIEPKVVQSNRSAVFAWLERRFQPLLAQLSLYDGRAATQ